VLLVVKVVLAGLVADVPQSVLDNEYKRVFVVREAEARMEQIKEEV